MRLHQLRRSELTRPRPLRRPEPLEARLLLHADLAANWIDGIHQQPAWESESFAANSSAIGPMRIESATYQRADVPVELRTYRIAVAATAEYTAFHGGTVADALAAIETTIGRVNEIYERDLAIHLELVPNNDLLIYTDPATDPYTNGDASAMLQENQDNLENVIGNEHYDVGHVFGTSGGGLATIGVAGIDAWKARGVSTSSRPIGESFAVNLVAHEIGHQFGAHHTFSSDIGSCHDGLFPGTAVEPGSGTTIMAYAGLCAYTSLQSRSDPYFHSVSIEEINHHIDDVIPEVGTRSATKNHHPQVVAGPNYVIPAATPFRLTATGEDLDGDTLTYSWEQADPLDVGSNTGPLFRVRAPSTEPARTFPGLADLLNGTRSDWELLPTSDQHLTFRVTARDNRSGGGGVDWDEMKLTVIDTGSPFHVIEPAIGTPWQAGATQLVQWDVAGTQSDAIGAERVNILLSTDGGQNFDVVLAQQTINDGSEIIRVPNVATDSARIKIEAADNVFFDISDEDFTITSAESRVAQTSHALIGVDFDNAGGTAPPGWTQVNRSVTPRVQSGLVDETGATTSVSLTIHESRDQFVSDFAVVVAAEQLPTHNQSLWGIDGQIYTSGNPLALTWSGLEPMTAYEIYIFAAEAVYSSIQQQVAIHGAGAPVVFAQSFDTGELVINDGLSDATRTLESFAKMVSADPRGEIEIEVTPVADTRDVVLAAVAIRQARPANQVPSLAAPLVDQVAAESTSFYYQLDEHAFQDADGDLLAYAANSIGGGPLPAWLTFDPAARTFRGVPAVGDVGSVTIQVVAEDGQGGAAFDDFHIRVDASPNRAPVLVHPIPDQTTSAGSEFRLQFEAATFQDANGDQLDYTATLSDGSALPAWLSFDRAARTFVGLPVAAGSLAIRVTALDGLGGVSFDQFSLTVEAATVEAGNIQEPARVDETADPGSVFAPTSSAAAGNFTLVDVGTLGENSVVEATLRTTRSNGRERFSNGYVVFDYIDEHNYKLAGVEAKNGLWVVAEVTGGSYRRLASQRDATITEAATHQVELVLTGNTVTLRANGQDRIQSGFNGNLLDGRVGLGAIRAVTHFDEFVISPAMAIHSPPALP